VIPYVSPSIQLVSNGRGFHDIALAIHSYFISIRGVLQQKKAQRETPKVELLALVERIVPVVGNGAQVIQGVD